MSITKLDISLEQYEIGLSGAVGVRVVFEVRDGLKPALVKGEGQEFTYLVMPVRLPAHVG